MVSLPAPIQPDSIKLIKDVNGEYKIDAIQFIHELNIHLQRIYDEASSGWVVTNKTEDRTLDCDCDDTAVLGDVLGTLIDDLITKETLES